MEIPTGSQLTDIRGNYMKAVRISGEKECEIVGVPDPKVRDHYVRIKVHSAPLCTESKLYEQGIQVRDLGHEAAGEVVEVGSKARVIGIEKRVYRSSLAKQLGVEEVIDPMDENALEQILDLTHGKGVDKIIETTDDPGSPEFLFKAVRGRGEITFISWSGDIPIRGIVGKGLTVHGAWHWNHLTDGDEMMNLIRKSSKKLDIYITHKFGLSAIKEAWDLKLTHECGKIIMHPQE